MAKRQRAKLPINCAIFTLNIRASQREVETCPAWPAIKDMTEIFSISAPFDLIYFSPL
jgi:hypothetical protein